MKSIIKKDEGNETMLYFLLSALPTLVEALELVKAVQKDRKEDGVKVF